MFPFQQSAYRVHYSMKTAVLSVQNFVVRAMDNGQGSPLMVLDLSAAFVIFDHEILLAVLSSRFSVHARYGIEVVSLIS
jgi:hypothetical protein